MALDRPELGLLKEKGYEIEDPWDAVRLFETKIAQFAGSKYGVAVDSCTDALFLCLKYVKAEGAVTIPAHTYCSVPMAIIHAGCVPEFVDIAWDRDYQLKPYSIYDAALSFQVGMYVPYSLYCLSFHHRKQLPIGKGGMILTNDVKAYDWFVRARYGGRNPDVKYSEDDVCNVGWNMYMTPEDAARGVLLFDDINSSLQYGDLRELSIFKSKDECNEGMDRSV